MGTTRFKGETASERLNFESISDSDMIQIRHLPGTLNDADKGISKAQLMSCPFGVCDTAANTALKTVSLADSNPDFVLVSGREVVIYFANANTETSPVINFEGSGSYPLFFDNGSPVGTWAAGTWMHLKFFSVEINDTLIQRWILLSPLSVDAVTANNMQSVTSNAVALAIKNHIKSIAVSASTDSGGNAYLGYDFAHIIPIAFVPINYGTELVYWQFATYGNNVYIRCNRTNITIEGTLYYLEH